MKRLLIISILFLLLSGGFFAYSLFSAKEDTTDSTAKAIIIVGDETLYQKDLQIYAEQYSLDPITDKEEILEIMISDSVLLQFLQSKELLELDASVYNSPDKNTIQRMSLIQIQKDTTLQRFNEGSYQVETITVFFWNGTLSSYAQDNGVEAAKEYAYSKIEPVYNNIIDNNASFEEASQVLRNDPTMEELDPIFQNHVYSLATYSTIDLTSNEYIKERADFILNAEVGDISEILLLKDLPYDSDGVPVEARYSISKLVDKTENLDNDISVYKNELNITYL